MTGLVRSSLVVVSGVVLMVAAEALELGIRTNVWRELGLPLWIGAFCTDTIGLLWTKIPVSLWAGGFTVVFTVAAFATVSVIRQIVGTKRLAAALARAELTHPTDALAQAVTRAGLKCRVRLTHSTDFSAFCVGLLSPEVWISTAVLEQLSPDELEAVLRHEGWHARRRDTMRVLIANTVRAAFFILPPVRESAHNYLIERELDADAAAVREMRDSLPLASALYKAVDAGVRMPQHQAAPGAFTTIDARIDQLVGAARSEPVVSRTRWLSLLVGAAGTILAGCLLVVAA